MKALPKARDFRLVHGAAVVLVVALFLWKLSPVLSPILLYLLLVALVAPYTGSLFHRQMLIAAGALVGLWVLADLGTLLAPFILALGLAYLLDPLVDRLERLRLPRALAIIVLGLPVLVGLGILVGFGVPVLARQAQTLIQRTPELLERLADALQAGVLGIDLPLVDEEGIARRLRNISPSEITEFLQDRQQALVEAAWEGALGLGRGLSTVLTILGYILLTPVLTFYLLRDWDGIVARVGNYIPRPRYEAAANFAREYDRLLSRYLHGQVIAATAVGLLTWIGLWIADFPNAGLVGAVAGVFNLVPYLGLIVSLVPALIISILSGAFLASVAKVAVVFLIVQFLDGNIVGPRIVGESVGLHPVLVILAVAVGGYFLGFVGLLLALPSAILLKLMVEEGLRRYRQSSVYLGDGAEEEG